MYIITVQTRTTRTPALWGYPPTASWLPIPLSHIGSQVKRRQRQSYKFKKFAKISLHATHFLKLLDKMCKYQMDPVSIVEDTERTWFCPQTDRRTDGQGDTSLPPFQLRWSGGYNYVLTGVNPISNRLLDMYLYCREKPKAWYHILITWMMKSKLCKHTDYSIFVKEITDKFTSIHGHDL